MEVTLVGVIDGFPINVAAKVAGVTPKTLENWDQRGFLKPSVAKAPSRGQSRIYSFRDLIAIRVASKLREDGISLQAIRRVVAYLRARKGLSVSEVLAGTLLITDGRDVYEVAGSVAVSALLRPGQRTIHVVPLDELVTELQAKARALRPAA